MIVVCDTLDHEDYPIYVKPDDNFWKIHKQFDLKNMQRILEVYDYELSWQDQKDGRVHNTPPRPSVSVENDTQ